MLGIVSLPLVHNLADVLCVGKDVVDQPTCVVLENPPSSYRVGTSFQPS